MDPNTTSTRTRNESELILLVPVLGMSQNELEEMERNPNESKGILGYKLLGMSHR